MLKTALKLTPRDHGRRMTLAEFEHAEAQEGCAYELGRGSIAMTGIPNPRYFLIIDAIQSQMSAPVRLCGKSAGLKMRAILTGADSE